MSTINHYIEKNIVSIVSLLIVIQPLIDLIIGVSIRMDFLSAIMSFIRVFILAFLLYYFVVIYESKHKKGIYIILASIFIYLILFFINMQFSFNELKTAMRVFYFPLIFITFFCIFEDEKKIIFKKYLLYALGGYAIIIITGYITNTAFNSYLEAKVGTAGYFNAANEIGGIFAIVLPFVFSYVFNKINLRKVCYFLMIISAIIILGTKTPFISLVICSIYSIVKTINKGNVVKVSLITLFSILAVSFFFIKTPIYKNLVIHYEYLELDSVFEIFERPELLDHFVFGSRLQELEANSVVYGESSLIDHFLGMGYMEHSKLIEMDIYDILYRQGIMGFVIYFFSVLYLIMFQLKKYNAHYILSIILIILISTFVGHTLTAPAVSTFVAIILGGLLKEGIYEN